MINNRFRATNIQRIIQISPIISHLFDYLTYLNIIAENLKNYKKIIKN